MSQYAQYAAISNNIAGIGQAFMQMRDPRARAEAMLVGNKNALLGAQVQGQNIDNQYRPGLMGAQTNAAQGSAAQAFAGANNYNAQADFTNVRTNAARRLSNVPQPEVELPDFNGGLDIYAPDGQYSGDDIGVLPPLPGNSQTGAQPVPTPAPGAPIQQELTPEQRIALARAQLEQDVRLATVFSGAGPSEMMQGYGRAQAMTGDSEQGLRNAATAISGNLPGAGEYGLTENADAFQNRALQNNIEKAAMDQQGLNQRAVFSALMDDPGGTGASSNGGGGGRFNAYEGSKDIGEAKVARFGVDGIIPTGDAMKAQGYGASVATLTRAGLDFEVAKYYADNHHGIPTDKEGFLWFADSKDYKDFNETPITPQQAAQVAAQYGGGGGVGNGNREADVMRAAQIFGYEGGGPAAQEQASQEIPMLEWGRGGQPVPQTGVEKPPGKAIGTEREKAEVRKASEKGSDHNAGTLGNILRAAKAEGIPLEDILATVTAGGEANDYEIARIFATSKGSLVLGPGGRTAEDLRNALKDGRALGKANINPERIRPYLRSSAPGETSVQQLVDQYRTP